MSRSQAQYVRDILEAISDAESFVEDLSFQELEEDRRTQYALQRTFEIIGEATQSNRINFFSKAPLKSGFSVMKALPSSL